MENSIIDFKDYTFRSHAVGKIASGLNPGLTENQEAELNRLLEKQSIKGITPKQTIKLGELIAKRDAKPELNQGVKTYLKDLHLEEMFNRRKLLETRQIEKGLATEQKSFSLYALLYPADFIFRKNEERRKNSFFRGLPDNIQGKVRDFKSSFELSTFPMFQKELNKTTNKMYYWQLQTYMDLFGMDEAELIFCLNDTPFNIIDDELSRTDWRYGIADGNGFINNKSIDLVVEKVSNMLYTWDGLKEYCGRQNSKFDIRLDWFKESFKEIPKELRCNVLQLEKNSEDLSALKKQVILCRKYLNELSEEVADKMRINVA